MRRPASSNSTDSINGHSTHLSRACPPSPPSRSYFTSQSSPLARHQMPAPFRHQHRLPCVKHGRRQGGCGRGCGLRSLLLPPTSNRGFCESTSRRRVNPRMFHSSSLDQPSGTRTLALTLTSLISSKSASARTNTFSSLICIASARRLLPPTCCGFRMRCYTFRGQRGMRPTPSTLLGTTGWKQTGVPSL
jgi:hypothetical protein